MVNEATDPRGKVQGRSSTVLLRSIWPLTGPPDLIRRVIFLHCSGLDSSFIRQLEHRSFTGKTLRSYRQLPNAFLLQDFLTRPERLPENRLTSLAKIYRSRSESNRFIRC